MIEIKLSQGAKPGHGGILPAAKVTPEIAETRGVPDGPRLHLAGAAQRLFDAARDDGVHRPAARPVGRQAGRVQALRRPSLGVHGHRQGDARDRHHAGLHRGRRGRRRHRRGADRIQPTISARRCAKACCSSTTPWSARAARHDQDRCRRAGSSAHSTSPACWRSAPTGPIRRAASCSRWAASSR